MLNPSRNRNYPGDGAARAINSTYVDHSLQKETITTGTQLRSSSWRQPSKLKLSGLCP